MKELSQRNRYHIPKERYLELKHFCLQYDEYKEYLKYIDIQYKSIPNVRTGEISKPVENLVINRLNTQEKIDIIEKTCIETDPTIAKWLLIGITKGMPYETLSVMYDIPCCRGVYYRAYRRFFYLLDLARQ